MTHWRTFGWGLSLFMLAERIWKHQMVVRFMHQPLPTATSTPGLISILQPVLSGDPTMSTCLEHNLRL